MNEDLTIWDLIFLNGRISIRERTRNGRVQAPRRQVRYKRKNYTLARVIWNAMHPDDLANETDDVHHKDNDTLNDCPENLRKEDLHEHRSRPKKFDKETLKQAAERVKTYAARLQGEVRQGKRRQWTTVKFDLEEAIQLRCKGLSWNQIATRINQRYGTIYLFFRKYDLEVKIKDGTIKEWLREYMQRHTPIPKRQKRKYTKIEEYSAKLLEYLERETMNGTGCRVLARIIQDQFPEIETPKSGVIHRWQTKWREGKRAQDRKKKEAE